MASETYFGNPPDSVISYADKLINGKILKDTVSACYSVCETKGATMPSQKTPQNLSSCISSIPAGGTGIQTEDFTMMQLCSKMLCDLNNEFKIKSLGSMAFYGAQFDYGTKMIYMPELTSWTSQPFAESGISDCAISCISLPKVKSIQDDPLMQGVIVYGNFY